MELSLRAEDSERRTRNAWTVMTPANVRIALHCDADAVLHFALMLIHPGLVGGRRLATAVSAKTVDEQRGENRENRHAAPAHR